MYFQKSLKIGQIYIPAKKPAKRYINACLKDTASSLLLSCLSDIEDALHNMDTINQHYVHIHLLGW
jgi:hypothetical protein